MKLLKVLSIVLTIMSLSACTQILVTTLNQFELTKIAIQGDKMYLMNEFNNKSYKQIVHSLNQHPKITTIVLTANPGSLDDDITFKLAREIRRRGLNTHLLSNSVIASGAVDLFLSGKQRTIEKGAKLGVHSWSDGSKQAKDIPRSHPDHKMNASYIKDMLGTDEFYWFTIYAAPADGVYWMKPAEITKYGLATQGFLMPSNDKTPFGKAFIEKGKTILKD